MVSWLLLSLIAAALYSAVNISDKYILSGLNLKPVIPLLVLALTGLFVSLVTFIWHGFGSLSFFHVMLAFIGGIFFILMTLFYFEAVKHEEISKIVPLFYLSPLFILLLARLYLGELLTIPQYLGTFLLVAGAIFLSTQKLQKITFTKAFWLMILAALCVALNQVITKYLLSFTDFWTIFAYMRVGAFFVLLPQLIAYFPDLIKLYKKKRAHPFMLMGMNEVINLGGVLTANAAASVGSITLVNALASIQPFLVLLLAIVASLFYPKILKEEIGKGTLATKFIAIAVMFVGVVLIS